MFELIERDAAGRLGKWAVGKHTVKTPNIAIVLNPNRLVVPPADLKSVFGADLVITNAYIISKSRQRGQFEEGGLHKTLGWDGPVYTDSGAFQSYSQEIGNLDNKTVVGFQKKIGSDVITPFDMFTFVTDSRKTAKTKVAETIKRIKLTKTLAKDRAFAGPIQGGLFLDLRKAACRSVAKLEPDVFAIGGIVPLMEQYRFAELVDILLTCKQNLPANAPIHCFGAGHPMVLSLLTAFGADLFDSAMYSLAAGRGAYLTTSGTLKLSDLSEFPCSCPECSSVNPIEIKSQAAENQITFLARHNLYATLSEMRTIRTAIRQGWLWELVQQRVRAHPALLAAFIHGLKKYGRLLQELDPVSKPSAFMWSGAESALRPEVLRAQQWLRRVKSRNSSSYGWRRSNIKKFFYREPFGKVPVGLKSVYPFGQFVSGEKQKKVKASASERAFRTIDYQFGSGASKPFKKSVIEASRKTGRLRRLWTKDKKILGTFRPSDGFFLPSLDGAGMLGKRIKKIKISDSDVAGFVSQGRALFAKFARPQPGILPGEEVAVVHKGKIIATGRALLNSKEMTEMKRGAAVEVRSR